MELRDFAQQVLLSADLDQKLFAPEVFTDELPGNPVNPPAWPGRPSILPVVSAQPIPAPPTLASLERPEIRGQALHTFAHHELQAAELMALALLRFPNAPASFRMGLARIIADEQRHFRLYQARAESWGVSLGEVGAGPFFWDTVVDLPTPAAFLAALSLTYEQANLDFTLYWKRAFAAVDDEDSVTVLNTVYEDEIQHVAHGVRWFQRFQGGLDFERYAAALEFPLSPGRAKGPIFDRAGRARAGLSAAFVDELELRNVSRGRPPRVFSFDPFVEEEVAGRTVKAKMRFVARDLGSLPMFLAHKEDVVLAPRPSIATLQPLHRAGFPIPEFLDSAEELGERAVAQWCPWGWSPVQAKLRALPWNPDHQVLYDKTWAFGVKRDWQKSAPGNDLLEDERGGLCTSVAHVEALLTAENWVAKAPFSSSGQHRIRLTKPLDDRGRSWLNRHLAAGPILVEPWVNRVLDLSVQVDVTDSKVKVLGLTRFWTASNGAYRGAVIGAWSQGVSSDVARVVHRHGLAKQLNSAAIYAGERAKMLGFRGPMGIDAMIYQTVDGLKLNPLLEVNPRNTMGRVALAIRTRCRGHGAWYFLHRKQVSAAGYESIAAFVAAVRALPMTASASGLESGVLFTSEPHPEAQMVTVLCVAKSWQLAQAQWAALGFLAPDGV